MWIFTLWRLKKKSAQFFSLKLYRNNTRTALNKNIWDIWHIALFQCKNVCVGKYALHQNKKRPLHFIFLLEILFIEKILLSNLIREALLLLKYTVL
jgi:hypothetical protein